MNKRNVFGTIFLVVGLGIFFILGANSISAELHDVLHEAPMGGKLRQQKAPAPVNKLLDGVIFKSYPTVGQLPHMQAEFGNKGVSTSDNPFQQFNVARWLGWAFVIAALAEVGVAYWTRVKVQVQE